MMGRPEPTLGFPSRSAAIRALHAQGRSNQEIAEAAGSTLEQVHGALRYARQKGGQPIEPRGARRPSGPAVPRAAEDRGGRPTKVVELNYDVSRELRPHAARRFTTVDQIAREIVEAVLEQGLVDRVLEGRF